ncbi:RHS repeat-associated core domain-containing protein, partial [Caballeronia sp. LZ035]|uniref:RHS repeat-associated core domain-containing protein n=1 Tax=Caballeronia sp. LZ035 TaxID=3038568 RepID=UPI00285ECF19
ITDPEGGVWRQAWDTRGNLLEQVTPAGCSSVFGYDALGQLTQVADAARRCTALDYDANGYLANLTDALGRVTHFTHDARGNLLHREAPGEGPTRYAWDKKDRLILCDLPSGAWVRCAYDGEDNLIRYEDEARQETRFTYYGQGQLQTRTDPDGSVTRYHYDTEEQLIGVSNPLGQTWHLKRDAAGRLIEEIDYFGQARGYGYDPAGHLTRTVDPLGRMLSIRCDPLGRIVSRIAEGSGEAEHYAYNKHGQLIGARNAHAMIERAYDLDGRLASETQKHADTLGSVSYEYDAAGQLQMQRREMRELNGEVCYRQTLSHEYDALGLARTLSIDAHEPIRFTHDLASRLSGIAFAPGLDHTFSYDGAGRLARQTARRAGHRETHIGYEYDVSGNLVTRSDSRLGVDRYRYDPLGRIVAHTDPGQRVRRYVYNAQGDRFSQVRATEQGREWHHPDGARWWLDAAGQLSERTHPARGVERFTWDVFGRMVGFENTANERWVYRYDALGRRIGKQAADVRPETGQRHRDEGARTWFLWDGDAMAGEVRRTALHAREARFYVYRQGGFEPLAMQVDDGACKRVYFYQNNPNGAPVRLSSADGDIVWETNYSVSGGADWIETRKVEQAIRLQGQYYDPESNLHYNRYRYFDPGTGSFISQDPIGLDGGLNPYDFAFNTIGWIDPLGLKCEKKPRWKKRRSHKGMDRHNDHGLKNHAERHSSLSPRAYLERGERNVTDGKMLKGGGRDSKVRYHVRKIGEDAYSVTITDRKNQMLSVDTWSMGGKSMSREYVEGKLATTSGVTAPKGFWESLE